MRESGGGAGDRVIRLFYGRAGSRIIADMVVIHRDVPSHVRTSTDVVEQMEQLRESESNDVDGAWISSTTTIDGNKLSADVN